MNATRIVAREISIQYPASLIGTDDEGNVINREPVLLINTVKNRSIFLIRNRKHIVTDQKDDIPHK